MKKICTYFAIACMLFAGACSSDDDAMQPAEDANALELAVTIDAADAVKELLVWQGGERMGIYADLTMPLINRSASVMQGGAGAYCLLAGNFADGDRIHAYYPYSSVNTTGSFGDGAKVDVLVEQTQVRAGLFSIANMPMCDTEFTVGGEADGIVLKPLAALVRVNVHASGYYVDELVQSVEINGGSGTPTCGTLLVDFKTGKSSVAGNTAGKTSVTLQTPYKTGKFVDDADPIYVAILPANYSATVTVTTDKAKYAATYKQNLAAGDCVDWNFDLSSATRTEIVPDTTPKYKVRWFELPIQKDVNNDGIEDSNTDWYYSHTMLTDAPSVRNFSACYSKNKLHPVWVAAPMHTYWSGGSGNRTDAYVNDPAIPCRQASKRTGYTRGHMIGSADRDADKAMNMQAFYFSNIGAQLSDGFNTFDGAWNNLEEVVDAKVCPDTLYQVVGVIFNKWTDKYGKTVEPTTTSYTYKTTTLPEDWSVPESTVQYDGEGECAVPTAWYKVVLRTKNGNSGKRVDECAENELQCAAFILGHYSNAGHKTGVKDMYTVTELEQLTGLTFFPNVPNAPKDFFDPADWGVNN